MLQLLRCSELFDLENSTMHIKRMALEGHVIFKVYITKTTVHTPALREFSQMLELEVSTQDA